jgi:transcriptional/translational regulatory protein YebC/TACO1
MQVALEAGAEDVVPSADTSVEVLADPLEFATVRAVLTHHGFAPATAEVTRRAATALELSGDDGQAMVQLLEALEGLEDVREVYSNVEISDEVLARFGRQKLAELAEASGDVSSDGCLTSPWAPAITRS